jgi:hypothetical protein
MCCGWEINILSFFLSNFFFNRARIWKHLMSIGIDLKESILPAFVIWRASSTNRVIVCRRHSLVESIPWNRLLDSLNVIKFGLCLRHRRTHTKNAGLCNFQGWCSYNINFNSSRLTFILQRSTLLSLPDKKICTRKLKFFVTTCLRLHHQTQKTAWHLNFQGDAVKILFLT